MASKHARPTCPRRIGRTVFNAKVIRPHVASKTRGPISRPPTPCARRNWMLASSVATDRSTAGATSGEPQAGTPSARPTAQPFENPKANDRPAMVNTTVVTARRTVLAISPVKVLAGVDDMSLPPPEEQSEDRPERDQRNRNRQQRYHPLPYAVRGEADAAEQEQRAPSAPLDARPLVTHGGPRSGCSPRV